MNKIYDPRAVLDTPMQENDAGAATVGEYLVALLRQLWSDGSEFSGKRPFGNSGWDNELAEALVRAGLVKGVIDPEWGLSSVNDFEVQDAINAAIDGLGLR